MIQDLEIAETADNGINVDDGEDRANAEAARFVVFRNLETVKLDAYAFAPAARGVIADNVFYFARSALNAGEDINVGDGTDTGSFSLVRNHGSHTTIRRRQHRASLLSAAAIGSQPSASGRFTSTNGSCRAGLRAEQNGGIRLASKRAMPTLEHEMTLRLQTRGPLASTDGSPLGARQYWEMTEGELSGARIHAKIAMPGGDWYRSGADGFGRPDVRVQLVTDDGQVIMLAYTGLVEVTDRFRRAAESGGSTQFGDQYMRMAMFFDSGAPQYAWLTQHLFVAEGRIAGRSEIEYRVYRVT